jgi:hypothetical protein
MSTEPTASQSTVIRIDLTDAQKQRVAEALGEARLAATGISLELSIEELEERIAPRITKN